jgi:serine/threonine protein phosphatase PrpC
LALPETPREAPAEAPLATPVVPLALPDEPPEAIPVAEFADATPSLADPLPMAEAIPAAEEAPVPPPQEEEVAPPPAETIPSAPAAVCPFCQAPRVPNLTFCDDCGLVFPNQPETPAVAPPPPAAPAGRVKGRYELGEVVNQRGDVVRYRGLDHGAENQPPVPVIVLRAAAPVAEPPLAAESVSSEEAAEEDVLLPSFDDSSLASLPATDLLPGKTPRSRLTWEKCLLDKARHPALPIVLDSFGEDDWEYLVEEMPAGQPLWDAWDDPEATAARRFGWLVQIADGLRRLHQAGIILEALPPEKIVVTPEGTARLTDLADLLPLPLPPNLCLRGTPYTAPELVLTPDQTNARADLYHFGALLYALHVGRELTEMDFERPGVPKRFIPQFPDIHPVFGRLLTKTFCREPDGRFPSDETAGEDPSGFTDLISALQVCQRTLDNVRLEMAAWTTTGMVRTGNEDAFAFLHAVESRQDDLGESALILVADGLGGYEAGEVAAALAIQVIRKYLLQQPLFAMLGGHPVTVQAPFDLDQCQAHFRFALKEANREVYNAAHTGLGRRGMGCTAEVVYVNGQHVVVGHVGDSRTYHLHEGRLIQLTRDQTLVNRLVELGVLTHDEAATDPRRSELQQAIGGRADVEPVVYHGRMKPHDWVVVCSDGLSNHVTVPELQEMLQREATSAEMAARRLVNFANIKGANDNATVVVVRAT